jgi:gluconate 2-dehydrogenase gamma chain
MSRRGARAIGRRRFLGAVTVAAPTLAACAAGGRAREFFFSESEWLLAEALCERLIPGDRDAGAREAGVVEFIDRQLVLHYRRDQGAYRAGLAAMDGASRSLFGPGFCALDPSRQDVLLAHMERDEVPAEAWSSAVISPRAFFALVREHAMQGFYGDPRHGGNRNGASWRMVGLPYPPVRGRDPYRFGAAEGEGAKGSG